MAVVFFTLGESGRLLIVIHHLAVDGISWRIILEDLANDLPTIRKPRVSATSPQNQFL
jgi:NRPS condensation-like uncharacterized protein